MSETVTIDRERFLALFAEMLVVRLRDPREADTIAKGAATALDYATVEPEQPPAPGEVRLTLSRDDAEWWRDVIDKADCWGSEHEAARVLDVLTSALNAAAAPGAQ